MTPPNPHALNTALDVETQRRDALAAQLAEVLTEHEAALAQLAQLEQYGSDTAGQFAQGGAVHDAARLRHQQPFLERLAQAVAAQKEMVTQAEQRMGVLQTALVTANQRIAALEALIQRNLERERARQQRQEQRQADEIASLRHQAPQGQREQREQREPHPPHE